MDCECCSIEIKESKVFSYPANLDPSGQGMALRKEFVDKHLCEGCYNQIMKKAIDTLVAIYLKNNK